MSVARQGNILVAEADEGVVKHLTTFLVQDGHRVEAVSDGKQTLAKLRTGSFDLLFLGAMMPWMDGIEVLHALRKEPLPRPIPIIAIVVPTALVDESNRFGAWLCSLGADEFLVRHHWTRSTLNALVQRLLCPVAE